jgi:hypothetical protein
MDTVTYKMYSRFHALVIKVLKLPRKLHKQGMASMNITVGNGMALEDPNASD